MPSENTHILHALLLLKDTLLLKISSNALTQRALLAPSIWIFRPPPPWWSIRLPPPLPQHTHTHTYIYIIIHTHIYIRSSFFCLPPLTLSLSSILLPSFAHLSRMPPLGRMGVAKSCSSSPVDNMATRGRRITGTLERGQRCKRQSIERNMG